MMDQRGCKRLNYLGEFSLNWAGTHYTVSAWQTPLSEWRCTKIARRSDCSDRARYKAVVILAEQFAKSDDSQESLANEDRVDLGMLVCLARFLIGMFLRNDCMVARRPVAGIPDPVR